MNQFLVKVKKLVPEATIPTYATDGSACFDLYAITDEQVHVSVISPRTIRTGLSFEIPKDHVMLVYSRSGHGFKNDIRLSNCVGIIDSDYRGELMVKLIQDVIGGTLPIKTGDRIAQAMIIPINKVTFEEVDSLGSTVRGEGGFGSTGQ